MSPVSQRYVSGNPLVETTFISSTQTGPNSGLTEKEARSGACGQGNHRWRTPLRTFLDPSLDSSCDCGEWFAFTPAQSRLRIVAWHLWAPQGAGKSTTAAAFARSGRSVISDDIVGLVEREGQFYVLPAYPHLCLWPESVQMLYGSPEALPRFIQDWEKRRLPLGEDGARFEDRTLLLEAVYLLSTRRAQAAPLIDAIPSAEALPALVANTYATNLIDRDMRAKELACSAAWFPASPCALFTLATTLVDWTTCAQQSAMTSKPKTPEHCITLELYLRPSTPSDTQAPIVPQQILSFWNSVLASLLHC